MSGEIAIEGLVKLYGAFRAVDDVSLTIPAGAFAALLGASGAGKSTILRAIGGFEQPDAGRIRIGGRDVTDLPPYRRDVNTVFQNYALFPHMSVADNVAYGLRQDRVPAAQRRQRVAEALDMVQLRHLAERRPAQLSGGQQQRVALARALVKRPAVLLLDEPLAALDRRLRQQMQVELKLLQHRLGTTFVFVTHDQEEALAMSDLIAVMRDGRIEQVGTPADLYDRPSSAFVAEFMGAQNFLAGTLSAPGVMVAPGLRVEAARGVGAEVPGQPVLAVVRPEHLLLAQDGMAPGVNAVAGTVAAVVMLGDSLEYLVRLADGTELLSRRPRAAGGPAEGAAIVAHWQAADATLFRHEAIATTQRAFARGPA
ncbi:ABC transporter ATP-binding protein [Zavarzinia sp. CC-PAN008]|uniref:ABC transporter ATP-binding protein n=1 Tax=Zavarzinia sp. CC-PAN008 TaxID=3243332 RepID=UPI003F744CAA